VPRADHRHQQRNGSKQSLDSFVSLFGIWLWWPFCTGTLLQTDDVYAQKPVHRAAFMRTLTQRGLCTDKLLHADAFTNRGFYANYTQKFLSTDALHKDAFARINKGTQALLNTEPFTRRNLCTEQLLHKETFTQENIDTEKTCQHRLHKEVFTHLNFYTQKLFQEQLLHNSCFPHRNLYAQKFPCTAVFTQTLLHTDAFTQKNNCTQRTFTQTLVHTAHFYTQPIFTRRGFGSPSWSPTFRVPPLKYHSFQRTELKWHKVHNFVPFFLAFHQSKNETVLRWDYWAFQPQVGS